MHIIVAKTYPPYFIKPKIAEYSRIYKAVTLVDKYKIINTVDGLKIAITA